MKKAIKTILSLTLCLSVMLCGANAGAVSQAEIDALEDKRSELEDQCENLAEQLDSMEQGRETLLERKAALDEQAELLHQDIELLKEQIAVYDSVIEDKAEAAAQAKAEEDAQYGLYCSRVRFMEENSLWSYLGFVLEADSITELLSRVVDVTDIMSRDEALWQDYVAARELAEETLAEYEAVQEAQRLKLEELDEQEAELAKAIEESSAVIEELESDIESYTGFQEAVESEMAEVQALIDEKAEELRRQQEAEAAAAAAQNKPTVSQPTGGTVSSGYYMWPSDCTTITSPFGPRVHPIYGQLKPHTGVDIGAWYGTEIYAAASGTVSLAVVDYSTVGYGTYVAIYHPNGTTTLYAHMSSLAVSVGQTVTQGQVIGYVGSTGASNGPHIHFEIRQNGVCVDPMLYF